ncbi:hypothetical protein JCGZ_08244 [Jatropha curcas]|uniref:DUF4005 domain-containing protein n=1 Tax=Jatropha curcas TaxID=180498 RepID=A0A067KPK0_JATCU|nr:protein IQ-DOMAIN 32 [Jatropha curcas]KDP36953.1 hypothetical protein JCGZ_08244 [Jatropha curcas]
MGRTTSCFKIITCGGNSADKDDLQVPENKSSSDKRGWSFRKRSARHRVLSNTVITEAPFSANKESSESASLNFQLPDTTSVPEKISVIQSTDEKPQLTFADSKESETIVVTKDESEVEAPLEESIVVVIQAAVRGFLAQRELLKRKNLVKLQAVVRGHLVRQHAVGTLRCVQAIIKMQALVRARRARLLQEGSSTEKKIDGKHEKAISKTLGKENSVKKPDVTYTSIEKLLSNGFARQLMESTPKSRPIHIKCDSSKPSSAWNWLERWISVSSAAPTPQPNLKTEEVERENKDENLFTVAETAVPSEGFSELADSKSNKETVLPSETDENQITYDADDSKFQQHHPTSSLLGDNSVQPQFNTISTSTSDAKESSIDIKSLPNQNMQSNENYQMEINSHFHKAEIEGEETDQPKRSMKRNASEQLETEGKRFVFGSRKIGNPAFIAVQSKFEELSSTANSNKSFSLSYQDGAVESNMDTISSGADTVVRTKELNLVGNSVPNNLRGQCGDSECGTELSVTSTLDSPDIFEVGATEYEHEAKSSEKETYNRNSTIDVVVEAKDVPTDPVSNPFDYLMVQPEKLDTVKDESVDSVVAADSLHVELKPERSASDVQRELYSETGGPAYRSSPEASPRSHMTVPESQGTPSSQVSVKPKRNRSDKSASSQKRKSLSAGKRSPSNPNHDSGARSSMEQLPKDQKNGKRRNSFGSSRPDNTDQEARDSSSSSSLPHFMQATESARAKIQANNSPRSSPDVHDREYIKKRQSLPGSNGRQSSPSIQRSLSQAQPGTKGNGSHVVHEKKWQR